MRLGRIKQFLARALLVGDDCLRDLMHEVAFGTLYPAASAELCKHPEVRFTYTAHAFDMYSAFTKLHGLKAAAITYVEFIDDLELHQFLRVANKSVITVGCETLGLWSTPGK